MKKKFRITVLLFLVLQTINAQEVDNTLYNIMPWPKEIHSGKGEFIINKNFTVSIQGISTKRLNEASTRFLRRLSGRTGVFFEIGFPKQNETSASLFIKVVRKGVVKLSEDESYSLTANSNGILLESETDIGAMRGLETLLQLATATADHFYIPIVNINDTPRFPWRGLMIDVARHYQPIHVIKRNLDAMASVKLNVFHWHLTDDQGFRIECKSHPRLHQMGSDGQYYTHQEIKDIVRYAADRGIRVIPEIDIPGHATAILTAYPELGSKDTVYQIERYAGVFDPTLDPTNEKTYAVLEDIFEEISTLFPDPYIHIGGDENEGRHWNENPKIIAFKKEHGLKSNHELQAYFNRKVQGILKKLGKKMMGWEEIMNKDLDTSSVIHSWKGLNEGVKPGHSLIHAAKNGYHTILSNGYYLDLMHDISDHYLIDPIPNHTELTREEREKVLGGEITMWGELVTPLSIDSRLWPRSAAIAERLWSPSEVREIPSMKKRLKIISFRLEELGISHLRNQNVILRNIANGHHIEALSKLTKVCQPLKGYTRNKGGTEYKSYSPFTLFADACATDASDAIEFKTIVDTFIGTSKNSKKPLESMLNDWVYNHNELEVLTRKTPLVSEVLNLSLALKELSTFFLRMLEQEEISKANYIEFERLIESAKKPHADVEIVVISSFTKLFEFLKKNEL